MAGNIVKWWKHKILGGYKQFSVQECTTDSEELMYHQVRASSSCSAPPDLLLVSDRENNIQLRSPVVNIITTTSAPPLIPSTMITSTSTATTTTSTATSHQATTPQTCVNVGGVSGSGVVGVGISTVTKQHQQQFGIKEANSKQLKINSKNSSGKIVNIQQQQQQMTNVLHQHSSHNSQQIQQQQQQHYVQHHQDELVIDGQQQQHHQQHHHQHSAHQRHSHHGGGGGGGKEERIRLEEFTCDVSVEGGKSSQPLQFSFTFYDLDGHHGKITKDDIVGIVYTIYESIGKSVVVPHCGSKTINVRLTVSPEGKSKTSNGVGNGGSGGGGGGGKLKRMPQSGNAGIGIGGNGAATGVVGIVEHNNSMKMHHHHHHHGLLATSSTVPAHGQHANSNGALTGSVGGGNVGHHIGHTRRQHRYRPRKLIRSDDEDDDSNSDKERKTKTMLHTNTTNSKTKMEQQHQHPQCCTGQDNLEQLMEMSNATAIVVAPATTATSAADNALYVNMTSAVTATATATTPSSNTAANTKRCESNVTTPYANATTATNTTTTPDCCGDVSTTVFAPGTAAATMTTNSVGHGKSSADAYTKQVSSRVKMLRKARKQKYQDHCLETRQRSLSVGNETCWKNRQHLHQQHQQFIMKMNSSHQQFQNHTEPYGDVVDGVQLRNPHRYNNQQTISMLSSPTTSTATALGGETNSIATMAIAHKRNSAECWKTALNRNDLISIIRESMEKNRLCFQMSGKPQANVSPIRQSQHHQHPQQLQQQHRQRSNTVSKIPTLIVNHPNTIINQHNPTQQNSNNIKINNSSNNNSHHHNNSSSSNTNTTTTTINNNYNNNSNHSSSNNNNSDLSPHDNSSSSLYHPQPHIPIYHQQMAINPAVLAAQQQQQQNGLINGHNKMNLCGYDSFLHATICGGGTQSHSPPPQPPTTTLTSLMTTQIAAISNQPTTQPIATVQPILTTISGNNIMNATTKASLVATATGAATKLPNQQQQYATQKIFVNNSSAANTGTVATTTTTTAQQIKTSKILRSGSYNSQQHHHSTTNSPQFHGYQRLASSSAALMNQQSSAIIKQTLTAMNLQHSSTNAEKSQVEHLEKWLNRSNQKSRKDVKNYDNLLYAKLSEKLRETTLNATPPNDAVTNKENMQRRHRHRFHHSKRTQTSQAAAVIQLGTMASQRKLNTTNTHGSSHTQALIPIHGDPIECENLLSPTTDEETTINELNTTTSSAEVLKDIATPIFSSTPEVVDKKSNTSSAHVPTGTLVDLNDESHDVVAEKVADTAANGLAHLNDRLVGDVDDLIIDDDHDHNDIDDDDDDGDEHIDAAAAIANTSASSASLIHRYVHEHIHHHYHHFEEKDE